MTTFHTNGAVRNDLGELIAFYDAALGLLHIDGVAAPVRAADHAHAADILAERAA